MVRDPKVGRAALSFGLHDKEKNNCGFPKTPPVEKLLLQTTQPFVSQVISTFDVNSGGSCLASNKVAGSIPGPGAFSVWTGWTLHVLPVSPLSLCEMMKRKKVPELRFERASSNSRR